MLTTQLRKDLIVALKGKEELRVSVIRFVLSAINYRKIEVQKDLSDEEIVAVIKKLVKQHDESITMFKKGNRQDLVDKEEKEMVILKSYLPKELADEEIEKMVKEVLSKNKGANFGQAMGMAMGQLKGKADGGKVAEIVKRALKT